MLRIVNGDVVGAVKQKMIAENIGFSKWKREALRILEGSGNVTTAPDGTRIVRTFNGSHYVGGFPSFVDDGHLTSDPWGQATAKLFGVDSSHGFGGAEDIYPVFVPQGEYETAYPEYRTELGAYAYNSLFEPFSAYESAILYTVDMLVFWENKIYKCIKDFPATYPKDGPILPTNTTYFTPSIVATGLKRIYDTAYSAMTDASGFTAHDRYIKKIFEWKYYSSVPAWEEYTPSTFTALLLESESQISLWWWIEESWVPTDSSSYYDGVRLISIETKNISVLAGYDMDGQPYYRNQLVKKITTKRFSPIYTASYLTFFDYTVDASIWYKDIVLGGGFFWGSEPFLRYDYLKSLPPRKFYEFVTAHLSFSSDYPKNDGGFLGTIIMVAAIIIAASLVISTGGAAAGAGSFELWLAEIGWAAIGDTLAFLALEYGVPALVIEAVGVAAILYEGYNAYSMLETGQNLMNTGGATSELITPDKSAKRMEKIEVGASMDVWPWEQTFYKFENSISLS